MEGIVEIEVVNWTDFIIIITFALQGVQEVNVEHLSFP